jgi:hypothetical protein
MYAPSPISSTPSSFLHYYYPYLPTLPYIPPPPHHHHHNLGCCCCHHLHLASPRPALPFSASSCSAYSLPAPCSTPYGPWPFRQPHSLEGEPSGTQIIPLTHLCRPSFGSLSCLLTTFFAFFLIIISNCLFHPCLALPCLVTLYRI